MCLTTIPLCTLCRRKWHVCAPLSRLCRSRLRAFDWGVRRLACAARRLPSVRPQSRDCSHTLSRDRAGFSCLLSLFLPPLLSSSGSHGHGHDGEPDWRAVAGGAEAVGGVPGGHLRRGGSRLSRTLRVFFRSSRFWILSSYLLCNFCIMGPLWAADRMSSMSAVALESTAGHNRSPSPALTVEISICRALFLL